MSLGRAEMGTSTSKPKAQEQRGCPCRGQGSVIPVNPMGQESSLSLDRHQAPRKERNAGPQWGQRQSPTKTLLWRGCQSRNLTNSKTGLVLISGNLMGKAQSSCPLHSQGAVAAPPVSAAVSLFPAGTKGPRLPCLCPLAAAPAAPGGPSSSFGTMVFTAASPQRHQGPFQPTGGRRSGEVMERICHSRGEERGNENVNFLPKK